MTPTPTAAADWFTVAATPLPHLRAWFRTGEPDELVANNIVVLLVQHLYPVDSRYRRVPGSDWTDTRTVFASASGPAGNDVQPLEDVHGAVGVYPAHWTADDVAKVV